MRVIDSGLNADDRVVVAGLLRAVPGQKVEPQTGTAAAGQRDAIAAMIAKFFIERPVLANVIAVLMVVIGAVALFDLPVAQYPDVVPPTVQVTTRYPGASARTVVDTVALPIEQQVNGVEDMLYMQSFSGSDGSYSLTVTFKIGIDLNFAQVLVQNRVASALSQLPQAVQSQGVTVQKKSTAILMFVTLTSPDARFDSLFLANYATIRLKDELARLPGRRQCHGVRRRPIFDAGLARPRQAQGPRPGSAGRHPVTAAAEPAGHRRPGRHAADAGRRRRSNTRSTSPAGWTMPSQFENVIVKTGDKGEITRVRDVGRVELGAQTYGQVFTLNGKPAAGMAIFQSPGANALDVANVVKAQMTALAKDFPQGIVTTFRSTPPSSSRSRSRKSTRR